MGIFDFYYQYGKAGYVSGGPGSVSSAQVNSPAMTESQTAKTLTTLQSKLPPGSTVSYSPTTKTTTIFNPNAPYNPETGEDFRTIEIKGDLQKVSYSNDVVNAAKAASEGKVYASYDIITGQGQQADLTQMLQKKPQATMTVNQPGAYKLTYAATFPGEQSPVQKFLSSGKTVIEQPKITITKVEPAPFYRGASEQAGQASEQFFKGLYAYSNKFPEPFRTLENTGIGAGQFLLGDVPRFAVKYGEAIRQSGEARLAIERSLFDRKYAQENFPHLAQRPEMLATSYEKLYRFGREEAAPVAVLSVVLPPAFRASKRILGDIAESGKTKLTSIFGKKTETPIFQANVKYPSFEKTPSVSAVTNIAGKEYASTAEIRFTNQAGKNILVRTETKADISITPIKPIQGVSINYGGAINDRLFYSGPFSEIGELFGKTKYDIFELTKQGKELPISSGSEPVASRILLTPESNTALSNSQLPLFSSLKVGNLDLAVSREGILLQKSYNPVETKLPLLKFSPTEENFPSFKTLTVRFDERFPGNDISQFRGLGAENAFFRPSQTTESLTQLFNYANPSREVGGYIGRAGEISDITFGKHSKISLPFREGDLTPFHTHPTDILSYLDKSNLSPPDLISAKKSPFGGAIMATDNKLTFYKRPTSKFSNPEIQSLFEQSGKSSLISRITAKYYGMETRSISKFNFENLIGKNKNSELFAYTRRQFSLGKASGEQFSQTETVIRPTAKNSLEEVFDRINLRKPIRVFEQLRIREGVSGENPMTGRPVSAQRNLFQLKEIEVAPTYLARIVKTSQTIAANYRGDLASIGMVKQASIFQGGFAFVERARTKEVSTLLQFADLGDFQTRLTNVQSPNQALIFGGGSFLDIGGRFEDLLKPKASDNLLNRSTSLLPIAFGAKAGLAQSSSSVQKLSTGSLLGTSNSTAFDTSVKEGDKIIQKTGEKLDPRITNRITDKFTDRFIDKFVVEPIPIPPDIPIPKIDENLFGMKLLLKEKGKNQKEDSANQAFDAFAKQKGKFIKLNKKPLSKEGALALAAQVVDNTSSASGKISKTSGIPSGFEGGFFNAMKFKLSKSGNSFTEKRSFRIDTPGEVEGITVRGLLAKKINLFRRR